MTSKEKKCDNCTYYNPKAFTADSSSGKCFVLFDLFKRFNLGHGPVEWTKDNNTCEFFKREPEMEDDE